MLGVLPLGTMNHFAKDLHIPLDLEGAVETIVQGHVANVDLGEVNGHIFVNNSSLGLYPSIVREREKQQRLGWGNGPLTFGQRSPFCDAIRFSMFASMRRQGMGQSHAICLYRQQ